MEFPRPGPLLELAAFFMRTETELVLKSRRVIPTRLLDAGFTFEYSELGPRRRRPGGAMAQKQGVRETGTSELRTVETTDKPVRRHE